VNSKNLQVAAVSLLLLAVPAGGARATPVTYPATSPFVAGTSIKAAEVNANFTAVKTAVDDNATRLTAAETGLTAAGTRLTAAETGLTAAGTRLTAAETSLTSALARITALEAANTAQQSYYAEQGALDANASVDDTWVDVGGAAIPVTFAASTKIRFQLFARIYNYLGTTGSPTSCSVRIVKDNAGAPLYGSFPETLGDWNQILTGGDISPNNAQQVALGGLVTVPAGTYNFKVQVVRKATASLVNSGWCQISRWNFSKARFFIDVVP
jgi:hypothetical protein